MVRKDAEARLAELLANSKSQYISQGVSFNRECPRQMGMLLFAFKKSASFSGFMKEMLALRMAAENVPELTPTSIKRMIETKGGGVKLIIQDNPQKGLVGDK